MIKTIEEADRELGWRRWWRDQTKDMHIRANVAVSEMIVIRKTLKARAARVTKDKS